MSVHHGVPGPQPLPGDPHITVNTRECCVESCMQPTCVSCHLPQFVACVDDEACANPVADLGLCGFFETGSCP